MANNAVSRAYEGIRDAITGGDFMPGSRLKEEELADRIGVSRTPVREALRRLDAEGVVDFIPNQGAFVAAWSEKDLQEIFELRSILESHGADRAAQLITHAELAALEEVATRMESLVQGPTIDRWDEITTLNREFHQIVLHAAANERLAGLLARIVEVPIVYRTYHHYSPAQLRRSLQHHRELIAALRARDSSWASSVMQSHIRAARNVMVAAEVVGR